MRRLDLEMRRRHKDLRPKRERPRDLGWHQHVFAIAQGGLVEYRVDGPVDGMGWVWDGCGIGWGPEGGMMMEADMVRDMGHMVDQ